MRSVRWWWLVVACAGLGLLTQWDTVDLTYLLHAGAATFGADGLHEFGRNPQLQVGPLALPVFATLAAAGRWAGDLARLLMLGCGLATLLLAQRAAVIGAADEAPGAADRVKRPGWQLAALAALPALVYEMPPPSARMLLVWFAFGAAAGFVSVSRRRAGRPLVAGLTRVQWLALLAAGPWMTLAAGTGHVEDAMALTALAASVLAQRRGHPVWAGLLAGIAVGCKPWAVAGLAIPLAPAADRRQPIAWRRRLAGAMAGVAVPALCFAPFVLADQRTLQTANAHVELSPVALVRLLGLANGDFAPSWLRSVELAAILAAALVARRRGPAEAVAAGLLMRVLLDPNSWTYYSATAVLAVAVADLVAQRDGRRTAAAAAITWLLPCLVTELPLLAALQAASLLGLVAVIAGGRLPGGGRIGGRRGAAYGTAGCLSGQPPSMSEQVRTRSLAGSVSRYSE